ncbi:hypothetical protein [Nocardioides xinjiangensis]|uniref:hypothetical protein n=1 Tax=Nocardioides xinjiangensis TaxID=2817376 RepID=UPI001B30A507|nr:MULTISPECIES: hypothetical protein [unclassified Nocardioides]
MKKMAVAAATTTIAALGSLVVAPAAQADPYPRSIDTECVAVAADTTVGPGDTVKIKFKWTADGNITPKGRVEYVVRRVRTGVVETGSFWSGAANKAQTKNFSFERKGNYYVEFDTAAKSTSVFRNCSASTAKIKVRNRF